MQFVKDSLACKKMFLGKWTHWNSHMPKLLASDATNGLLAAKLVNQPLSSVSTSNWSILLVCFSTKSVVCGIGIWLEDLDVHLNVTQHRSVKGLRFGK